MKKRNVKKLVRVGNHTAEVDVELLDDGDGEGWGPYLMVSDALKLEGIREVLFPNRCCGTTKQ